MSASTATRSRIGLKCLAPRPMASVRLLCIPYAGGGALAFHPWTALLPAHVEAYALQLPGREDAVREPPLVTWPALIDALADAVAPLPGMPTAVFGHSLGAVIALELARWMHRHQPGRLVHLFASGRPWPGHEATSSEQLAELVATAPDDALLQHLDRRYGSLSTSLSHPEIRDFILPILRADLCLLAAYRHAPAPALDCALTVFAGSGDPTTPAESLDGWQRETRGAFAVRMFAGQHFFLESGRKRLVADIVDGLG